MVLWLHQLRCFLCRAQQCNLVLILSELRFSGDCHWHCRHICQCPLTKVTNLHDRDAYQCLNIYYNHLVSSHGCSSRSRPCYQIHWHWIHKYSCLGHPHTWPGAYMVSISCSCKFSQVLRPRRRSYCDTEKYLQKQSLPSVLHTLCAKTHPPPPWTGCSFSLRPTDLAESNTWTLICTKI
jgi:hypothetical protein